MILKLKQKHHQVVQWPRCSLYVPLLPNTTIIIITIMHNQLVLVPDQRKYQLHAALPVSK